MFLLYCRALSYAYSQVSPLGADVFTSLFSLSYSYVYTLPELSSVFVILLLLSYVYFGIILKSGQVRAPAPTIPFSSYAPLQIVPYAFFHWQILMCWQTAGFLELPHCSIFPLLVFLPCSRVFSLIFLILFRFVHLLYPSFFSLIWAREGIALHTYSFFCDVI